jgi:predicted aldo/keto reductase-like oxidoreductase
VSREFREPREPGKPGPHDPGAGALSRRRFLETGLWAGTAVGLGGPLLSFPSLAGTDPPSVRRYVRLGRTGLEISDISFGGSRLGDDESLVRHALDRGINYFDTAEGYTGGRSETVIGRALEGRRDDVFLTSKVKANAGDRWAEIMTALEGSLKRLRTDHVDVYFNHAVNDVDRLRNAEWGEFAERARAAGKIRFTGMSGHGGRLVECLDYALDHDLVDVVLVGYNFGQDPAFYERWTKSFDFVALQPDLPRVLAKARRADVGVVAMKTLRGAKLNDLRPYETDGATFAQAAFRWVLSGGLADALIVTMRSTGQIDEYLGASGARPGAGSSDADAALLQGYELRHGDTQCRYGCNHCEGACPAGVAIADVLRSRMYAEDYGDREQGREEYARIGRDASACASCADRRCLSACPFGLDVSGLARRAHDLLGA